MEAEQYREVIKKYLTDKRYNHSVCVSEMAVKLAEKYGADKKKAETAGILHDIMKDTTADRQLQLINQFGIILDNFEKNSRSLWHARLGAAFIEKKLGIDDNDIINAVKYHTTGKANMTLLEKIIFTADFISDDRDYDGVEKIRQLALKNLNEAMLEGLSFTLCELSENRRIIHPDTLSAYNSLIIEKEGKKH